MASSNAKKADTQRPRPLHTSKSFTRVEPSSPGLASRSRANTVQNGAITSTGSPERKVSENNNPLSDVFEKSYVEEEDEDSLDEKNGKLPVDFDELPIELVSLTDSFIDSLSAKVYSAPPNAEKLSALFQDFYVLAGSHIDTHISTISLRQHRESSPSPSSSSRSSTASKIRVNKERPKLPVERKESEQQMLTTEEIADRKRARKVLELKRVALEEAVERRVCEGIYTRIWRHRSTQDEAQDEKLRSKTAALSVVGIGLTDLGIDLGEDGTQGKEDEVREWLSGARNELCLMNNEKYPLGKLRHLKAAHKCIVDTLSHFHPSSSADEIMPMLIYTLITSPPEGINVISNLYFVQRFRTENKIDGEAAYCLTNLEAAITFLETVDLASLRADEKLSGPHKSGSQPATPRLEQSDSLNLALSAPTVGTEAKSPNKLEPSTNSLRPVLQSQNRRLSELLQPAQVLGAAGDVVLNTADQGFKTIGDSLGSSYKFLLGKLKERQDSSSDGKFAGIVVPKTLDDARKLVGAPPQEDDELISGSSSLHSLEAKEGAVKADKVLNMIGGRQATRDRSADSNLSSGSSKRVAFAEDGKEKTASPLSTSLTSTNPLESMRNLSNTFNPMSRIAGGVGMIRGFGRAAVPSLSPAVKDVPDGGVADLTVTFPELLHSLPPRDIPKIAPPIKRFMEVKNPGELQIKEVVELLRDYRRLAESLKVRGAFNQ